MERLKKWRKGIILLVVISILIVARIFLFESVWIDEHMSYFPNDEKYKTYMLFEGKFITEQGFLKSDIHRDEYVFMFQWQYDKLVEEIRKNLYMRLDEVVEQYQSVSGYEINETGKVIYMYYNSYSKSGSEEVNGMTLHDVQKEEIERMAWLLSIFTKNKGQYNVCWFDASLIKK